MRWTWRQKREHDLERELRSDLELEAAEQQENGLSAEEARYAARRALGNTTLMAEEVRETWGWTWIGSCIQDLRFGSRILVKSPGVTLAVVISLALGLGATTALFSLLNSLLFKALPVPEPERLIVLSHGTGAERDDTFSYPQLAMLRDEAAPVAELFGYASGGATRLESAGVERKVQTQFVSGSFFRILQVQPALGRLLQPADDVRGSASAATAVISHRLWRSTFRSDPSVVGRKILLDSVPLTIVGVTPRSFFGVETGGRADVMLPFASKPVLNPQFTMLECKNCFWLRVMGRLKPGYSTAQAEARLNVVWRDVLRGTMWETLPERYKADYFADRLAAAPGATGLSDLRSRFTKPLYVLLAMTGVILLISCANVANLLLARALARHREIAVRLSIGAKRGRLVRQLLTESALLAMAALVAGTGVYLFCVNGLLRFLESGGQPVYLDTSPDLRMVAFVSGTTLLTLALVGLTPALRATRYRLTGTLAESSRIVAGRASLSRLILCGQLALSFTLLTGAILLARSLYDLKTFNAGFRRDHLLLISPDTSRDFPNKRDQLRYTAEVLSSIRDLSGIRSASASVVIPMEGSSWQGGFTAPGFVARKQADDAAYENMVTPGFFRTMGTRLLLGRDFAVQDGETAPKVAIVNESFAQRYWRNENPLGKQFHRTDNKELITVVGVVEDAKYRDFRKAAPPSVYWPLSQIPPATGWSPHLEVWTYGDPHALIAPVREILTRRQKDLPATFRTFTEMIDERLLYERLLTALSVSFGGLGILICAVGIYGVAAYSVNRRTGEIGIRMALGATPGAVMRLIMGEQLLLVGVGLGAGAAGALLLTRFLRAWLFGVSPTDVPSLLAAVLGLAGIAALATSIPARRASEMEPLRALRHE
jgi:predicted permease